MKHTTIIKILILCGVTLLATTGCDKEEKPQANVVTKVEAKVEKMK